MSEHFHARIPDELAERFEVARRLDHRSRSEALRVAMNTYIEKIAGLHAMNENDVPAEAATPRNRDAVDAATKEVVG
jgi:metal-responsive CopG/Arc/MetJ family transcriptional regulator